MEGFSPLLRTKFYIPRQKTNRIQRSRLIVQLNACLDRRLTLISAPAGFGKTTLVAEWAAEYAGQSAWLTLDEGDNDPVRFFNYFIAALQAIDTSLGDGVLELINTSEIPKIEAIFTLLINQIHEFQYFQSFISILPLLSPYPPRYQPGA